MKEIAIKGAIWSALDKVVNQIGLFFLFIYLSRILTPSDFGLIAMLTIFLSIAQSLVDSGLSQALIQKSDKANEIDFSTVFYTSLLISIIIYGMLFFFASNIASFYNQPELKLLARVLCIVIIINSLYIVPKAILTIDVDFKSQGFINTISTLLSSIVTVFMIFNDYSYWSLVGMSVSRACSNAILYLFCSQWMPKLIFSIHSFKELFFFGSKLLAAGLLGTLIQNIYILLLGRFFSATQVGYYQQGYNYTNMLSGTIVSVVQGVTYPLMTSVQEDTNRLIHIYIKIMGITTLITFPLFFGFIAISEEFVLLFLGEDWAPIIPVLIVLSYARVITPINALNLNVMNAKGRSDLFLKTELSKVIVVIITLLIGLPYGMMGIAIAQFINTFIAFFINSYYPGKLFGFNWLKQFKLLIPTLLVSIIMLLLIGLISHDNMLVQMLLKVVSGVTIYILLCVVFKIPSFFYLLGIVIEKLNLKNKPL